MAHGEAVISKAEVLRRQMEARQLLEEAGCAALVAFGGPFYDRPGPSAYLSNHFPPFPAVAEYRGTQVYGYAATVLFCGRSDATIVLCDGNHRADLVAADEVRTVRQLGKTAAEVVREMGISRVAVAGLDLIPASHYAAFRQALGDCEIVPFDNPLWELRMVKSDEEQHLLREAAKIADIALRAAIAAAEPGVPETHVCAVGTATALRAGADYVRYLRVHTGPWSRIGSRWPQATSRIIEEGDLVYLDVIGARGGYQFDVLRTTVAGKANPATKRLLDVTLEALHAGIDQARPGQPARSVYDAIHRCVAQHGLNDALAPFAGHGIGLETVEPPFITADDPTELKAGMVLCIEPKLAVPDVGGASIEYEVIVTDGTPEVITELPGKQW